MPILKRKKPRSVSNFRDLGGIVAADGRKIRHGMLYRSGHHAKLSEKDAKKLRDRLGIIAIVDLRSESELSTSPDVEIEGVKYHRYSSLSDEENPAVTRQNRRTLLEKIIQVYGDTHSFLTESYRKMVTTPRAIDAYSRLLKLLLEIDEDGAVLWHCTQGKDRAGVGTAAVLMALGVSREEIMRDYLRTNRHYMIKNKAIYALVCVAALSFKTATAVNHLLTARPEYLETAFDTIDECYGGTAAFLRDGLGLSDDDILKLRAKYLA